MSRAAASKKARTGKRLRTGKVTARAPSIAGSSGRKIGKGPDLRAYALLAVLAASGLFYLFISSPGGSPTGAALDGDIFNLLYGNGTGAPLGPSGIQAMADGNVNCNPPLSGTWTITGNVVCDRRSITGLSSVIVSGSGNLTLLYSNVTIPTGTFLVRNSAHLGMSHSKLNLTNFISTDTATVSANDSRIHKSMAGSTSYSSVTLMGNSTNVFRRCTLDYYYVLDPGPPAKWISTGSLYYSAGGYANNTLINCTLNLRAGDGAGGWGGAGGIMAGGFRGHSTNTFINTLMNRALSDTFIVTDYSRNYIHNLTTVHPAFVLRGWSYTEFHGGKTLCSGAASSSVAENATVIFDGVDFRDSCVPLSCWVGWNIYACANITSTDSRFSCVRLYANGQRTFSVENMFYGLTDFGNISYSNSANRVNFTNTLMTNFLIFHYSPSRLYSESTNVSYYKIFTGAGDNTTFKNLTAYKSLYESYQSTGTAFSGYFTNTNVMGFSYNLLSNSVNRLYNLTGLLELIASGTSRNNAQNVTVYNTLAIAAATPALRTELRGSSVSAFDDFSTVRLWAYDTARAAINTSRALWSIIAPLDLAIYGANRLDFGTLSHRTDFSAIQPPPTPTLQIGDGIGTDTPVISGYVDMPNMPLNRSNVRFNETTTLTRYYPVIVYDSLGYPKSNANATIYTSGGAKVSSSLTNASGIANPWIVFTRSNYLNNFTLNVTWNPTYEYKINLLTDTPIVIHGAICYNALGGGVCEAPGNCGCITQALNDSINCWKEVRMNGSVANAPDTCAVFGQGDVTLNCSGHAIDGDGTGDGVFANGKSGIAVKDCNITDWQSGIFLRDVSSSTFAQNFLESNGDGVYLEASDSNLIDGNTILNSSRMGISAVRSDDLTATGNTIKFSGEAGISPSESDDFYAGDNLMVSNGAGISCSRSYRGAIEGNNITHNGDGIGLSGCVGTQVLGNSIVLNDRGIDGWGATYININGNNVTDGAGYGVVLFVTEGSRVETNLIVRNNFSGIGVVGRNVSIIGNNASFNGAGGDIDNFDGLPCGILISGWAGPFLFGSYLNLPSDGSVVSMNVADNNEYAGIGIATGKNLVITGNRANTNTYGGIGLINIDDSDFSGNIASDNLAFGLFMDADSDGNTFNGNLACGNGVTDVNDSAGTNIGDLNTCDTVFQWNDNGTTGCTTDCAGCGNGTCDSGENCATCPEDCGLCCNDSLDRNSGCDTAFGETCYNCQTDCGACCGQDGCQPLYGETCQTCETDCGACCGNDVCDNGETCESCVSDCSGLCVRTLIVDSCPNGVCDNGEDCYNCPSDCTLCPTCGDLACNGDENCANCQPDCGDCPASCGNGACESGENSNNCCRDCGGCGGCSEPWECEEWGQCVNGLQSRECDCGCGDEDDCTGTHVTERPCGCATNGDCEDREPCTTSVCTNGACVYTPQTGNPCDDGDPCTAGDRCVNGNCVPTTNICPKPQENCTAEWACGPWGACVNNYRTRSCTCACPGNACIGSRTSREQCATPGGGEVCRLTLKLSPQAPRVGDTLSIEVLDANGNLVIADLTVISPDGKITKITSPHSQNIDKAGTWQVVAAKDGCIGDAEEVKAAGSQMPGGGMIDDIISAITGQPLVFGLVLLLLVVFLLLLLAKRRKKKEEEFEKV